MQVSQADVLTHNFYQWEERGRGWALYPYTVQLEPSFIPYLQPQNYTPTPTYDDGRVPTLWDKVKGLFQNDKQTYSLADSNIHFHQSQFLTNTKLCVFQVNLPRTYVYDLNEMEGFLNMLGYSYAHHSFEIIASHEEIVIQWSCREEDKERFLSQFRSSFPQLGIVEKNDAVSIQEANHIAIVDFGTANEFMLPMGMFDKSTPDPLKGIIGIFERLLDGEFAMLQILFQGCKGPWTPSIINSVTDDLGNSFFVDDPEMPKLALEKVSHPLFSVVIRVVSQTRTQKRTEDVCINLLQSLIGNSKSYSNQLIALSNEGYLLENHIQAIQERLSYRTGMILNLKELLMWVHIPDPSITSYQLTRSSLKTKPISREFTSGKYYMGNNWHLGEERPVFVNDDMRLRHTHVIGATGSGKSNLLLNLLVQDIKKGVGCTLIDPHGDLVDKVMEHIPEPMTDNIVLVDPSDIEFPIGLNLLEAKTEAEKTMLSSDLVMLFKEHATSWGDQMTGVLANAINAFLESDRGGTLMDLRRFLIEKDFRQTFLETVKDPTVTYYWHNEFSLLKSYSLMPLLTRLDTFLRPKVIRNMLAQQKGLDFAEILNSGKTLLVKLPQGMIGEENSYLLGTLFVAKLYQAALGRQNLKPEDRLPYYLYLDEFQHFMTPSLKGILSGTRKYGLGLVLAHQDLAQLFSRDSELGNSIVSNPAIRISFRVGDMDAKRLEDGYANFDASDLQSLQIGEAIMRIGSRDKDANVAIPLMDTVDKNLVEQRVLSIIEHSRLTYGANREEIEDLLVNQLESRYETKNSPPRKHEDTKPVPPEKSEQIPEKDIEESAKEYIESQEKKKKESLHRSLQRQVKELAESYGYKATIEDTLSNGGRVDVGLLREGKKIACEISVTNTPEYEVENIRKCLSEGFQKVFLLIPVTAHREAIIKKASTDDGIKDAANVFFGEYADFVKFLIGLQEAPKTETKRVKGYRVKVEYHSQPADVSKTQAVSEIIANSLKRGKSK